MTELVQVQIGNNTPDGVETTTGTVTYVLHLWLPSGRESKGGGRDAINHESALRAWRLVYDELSNFFDVVPLATCSGTQEATNREKWTNVFEKAVTFPQSSQKPYHVRFTVTPKLGITLPDRIQIPKGSKSILTLSDLLSETGVTFNVTV